MGGGIRGLFLNIFQQNTESEAKNVDVELTIDGVVHTIGINAANLKYHSVALDKLDDGNLLSCASDAFPGYMMMGRSYYDGTFGVLITNALECGSLGVRVRE